MLPLYNVVNFDVIYPATQKHISKHTAQAYRLIHEDPELYERATLPYIQAIPASRLGWVYNILERKVRISSTAQPPGRHTLSPRWSAHNLQTSTSLCWLCVEVARVPGGGGAPDL